MLTIHKASAGSGKTFALTREYLKLLLGIKRDDGTYRLRAAGSYGYRKPKAHGSILAVTFTNKATQEMTGRIISELAKMAKGEGSPYETDFCKLFACDAPTLRRHADRALADLLFNFSWFNVSTIDSFFQRVLNTFARELELPPTRAVFIDDAQPLAAAMNSMVDSVSHHRRLSPDEQQRRLQLTHWMQKAMTSYAREGNGFNILSKSGSLQGDMLRDFRCFFNEKYKLNREKIDAYLADPKLLFTFADSISPDGEAMKREKESVQLLCSSALTRLDGVGLKALMATALDKYTSPQADFTAPVGTTIVNGAADGSSAFKAAATPDSGDILAVEAACQSIVAAAERTKFYRKIRSRLYNLGLFGFLQFFLEEFRHDNEALLLSDTNDLLRRIISEDETPFIYERMGTAIRHYLIDEFQDTSQMQWENMRSLVLESLSSDNDNLIIGDEKQCIYRFRNSDPQLLGSRVEQMVKGRFPDAVNLLGNAIDENCNWRSAPAVVTFNNTLFYYLARKLDLDTGQGVHAIADTYAGLIQTYPQKHDDMPGYVNICFLPTVDEDDDEEDDDEEGTLALPGYGVGESALFDGENELPMLRRLAAEIHRQLQAGYSPSDITILTRTGWQGAHVIKFLMSVMQTDPNWHHGLVPLMSVDALSPAQSPAVKMIVNVLRLCSQPLMINRPDGELDTNRRPLKDINPAYRRYRLLHRYEMCKFDFTPDTDGIGNPLLNPDGSPKMRHLSASEALEKAIKLTSQPIGEASDPVQQEIDRHILELAAIESPTLLNITEMIIARFLSEESRRRENAFITAFQDVVMEYCDNHDDNIQMFLKWWELNGDRQNVDAPEGLEAIRVMTVHKSKGLEFTCVHLPYANWEFVPGPEKKSITWFRLDPAHFPGVDPACIPPLMPLDNLRGNKDFDALRTQAQEWETEQKIDALNVAYVAFTRAVRELNIYCNKMGTMPSAGKRASEPLLSDFIHQLLFTDPLPELPADAAPWTVDLQSHCRRSPNGLCEFILGAPTVPSPQTEADAPSPQSEGSLAPQAEEAGGGSEGSSPFPALLRRVPNPPSAPGAPEMMPPVYEVYEKAEIKAAMDIDDLRNFSISDDRCRGIFLHAVLAGVRCAADLPRVLARTAYRFRLSPQERDNMEQLLSNALADPRVQPWFAPAARVLTERGITAPSSMRRPDRVVWLPDGRVVVVDYKFGHLKLPKYAEQVKDYCGLLMSAGYPTAEGYLWYPLTSEIIKV